MLQPIREKVGEKITFPFILIIYPINIKIKSKLEENSVNYEYKEQFRKELVEWFNREKRDLPWRHTTDPYKIWVSVPTK